MPAVGVDLDVLARVGLALADDTRRRILVELLAAPEHPAELADRLELTRQNVSNHLGCLRSCGLVVGVPEGRRVRYQLADPGLARALQELCSLRITPVSDSCDGPELAR